LKVKDFYEFRAEVRELLLARVPVLTFPWALAEHPDLELSGLMRPKPSYQKKRRSFAPALLLVLRRFTIEEMRTTTWPLRPQVQNPAHAVARFRWM